MSMGKALVIVESPTKAKTINKYLGNNYVVKSSLGHIRDLPASSSSSKKNRDSTHIKGVKDLKKDERSALVKRMGIDPWNGWQAQYEVLPGKEKIVNELKQVAKKVDHIYLATDLDREGEAIAWHLREIIGGDNKRYSRVMFNEITKNSIRRSFEKPSELNINRVNAQQARRFMDRVVGYMVSPLLWEKIARGLSAGRVQSVAVRLIVERERAIKAFVPKEFWKIAVDVMTSKGTPLRLQVTHQNNQLFLPRNSRETMGAIALLEKMSFKVLERKDRLISSRPSAPFITSTLQRVSSIRLGFSVKKTMMIAQRLYEAGYITYMRTDSTNLSQDAVEMVRRYIYANFGKKYLPEYTVRHANKRHVQEAHEAIRPSDISIKFEALKNMEADAKKLYQLIWSQFVACQMMAAKYNLTTLIIGAGDFRLKTYGRILCFDGWTKVMSLLDEGNEDRTLPVVKKGDEFFLANVIPVQHFTKPPTRFSEASLVKELEKRGIGRPSTYASIITTIQDRGYVRLENRHFYAEKIGEIVTDCLEENFHKLMSYNFTAQMENCLDGVANHQVDWKTVLDGFFIDFINQLNEAKKDPEEGGMRLNSMVMTGINCPTCGRRMGIRTAMSGVFLACSGYTLPPKERCKSTINLVLEKKVLNILERDDSEVNALRARRRCKKCSTLMDSYLIDLKRRLHVCGNNPICDGYESEDGEFYFKDYDGQKIKCEKCGSAMYLKMGRFSKYIACINDECKNTRKILHNGEVGPPKKDPIPLPELVCKKSNAYFVLREGAAGIFLAANTFPKSRETRAPLVEELHRFRDRLPLRLQYLADAPQCDAEGNKTVVRFNRRTNRYYVTTENKGKTMDRAVFFVDGKWVEYEK